MFASIRLWWFVSACAWIAPVFAEEGPKAQLKRAEELLRGPGEAVVRSGAQLCLKLNSVASMELLLDSLRATQPHYRDIVWETLPDFTDPYARKRVEQELKSNKKNDRVRQWCAQALGRFGDPTFGPTLERALSDSEDFVRTAAAQSIGVLKYAKASAKLLTMANAANPFERAYAAEALARIDPVAAWTTFEAALADGDGGVRCFILGCVPELYPDRNEDLGRRFLTDADWRARMQAVDNLCAAKTKTAVDALIDATADGRPIVAARATHYLQGISGTKFTLKEQWQEWWRVNREAFAFPEGDAPRQALEGSSRATYNGMLVVSDHVAFVIDRSGDMIAKSADGKPKHERAKAELDATLSRLLGQPFTFNAFTYGGQFREFEKEPVLLDKKVHKKVLEFVEAVPMNGAKDIWGVLETVLSDPELDTVYLLSSGEPEVGLYVHWNRVTEHLRELNRFHKVTIHCVAYTNSDWYREQLENIAKCTGGEFKASP
ncbi:MAG: HEAT repeat domain-containing protein [Planctomycetes bacterium]|nr:HEAT repeat domain-containing protein [Planctomycetota bacterium]